MYVFERSHAKLLLLLPQIPETEVFFSDYEYTDIKKIITKLALGLQDRSDGLSLPRPQFWGGQNTPAPVLAPSCGR